MKVSIVGVHNLKQTIHVSSIDTNRNNEINNFELKFDESLTHLASFLKEQGHEVSLIANFSSAPMSIMALNELESNGVSVYPDLQNEITYDLTLKTDKDTYIFKDQTKLSLSNFQTEKIKQSEYLITNLDSYDILADFHNYKVDKVIVINTIPMFRALNFVEGIVLDSTPENKEETITSLMQSGLSWMAIFNGEHIEFHTLKHSYKLNFDSYHAFLDQFLKALEAKALITWLEANQIT